MNVQAALARDSLNGKEPSLDDPASMTLLPATHHDLVSELVRRWRDDPGATYRSWFLWDERLKNFRSIRRGLQQVVAEIESGRFGVAYRGSSLETVVHSIAVTSPSLPLSERSKSTLSPTLTASVIDGAALNAIVIAGHLASGIGP